jgi:hypothetical protein
LEHICEKAAHVHNPICGLFDASHHTGKEFEERLEKDGKGLEDDPADHKVEIINRKREPALRIVVRFEKERGEKE